MSEAARSEACVVCGGPPSVKIPTGVMIGGNDIRPTDWLAYCSTHMQFRPDAQALAAAEARGRDEERARWEAAIAQTAAEQPYDKTSREHGNAYAEGWTDACDIVTVRACNTATPATTEG